MRQVFFLLFFGLSTLFSFAQLSRTLDSLEQTLITLPNDSVKIDILNKLAWEYRHSDYSKATDFVDLANHLSEEINYKKGAAAAIGIKGRINHVQGNNEKAMELALAALKIAKEIKDSSRIVHCYNDMGVIYDSKEQYSDAINYYTQSLAMAINLGDSSLIPARYGNIGYTYIKLEKYELALEYFQKSLLYVDKEKNMIQYIITMGNIGIVNYKLKQNDTAKKYLEIALIWFDEVDMKEGIAETNNFLGLVDVRFGKLDSSLIRFNKALNAGIQGNIKEQMAISYQHLADVYEKMEQYDMALKHQKSYQQVKDSLVAASDISKATAQFEKEKRAEVMKRLDAEKQLQDIVLYSVSIGLGLVVLLIVILSKSYFNKQKSNKLLLTQNEKIEQNHKNLETLNQIGQKITSSLSVEVIIEQVYESINSIMDASAFGIGIYNEKTKLIDFPGFIEKGKKLPFNSIPLDNEALFSVNCFRNSKIIFIEDLEKELSTESQKDRQNVAGDMPHSLIYLPINLKDKTIAILTVQSFEKNAYTEYHLNILKGMVNHIVIALENATLYEQQHETALVLEGQNLIIEEKNKEITDSINYARRIQQAILPPVNALNEQLNEGYVLFKPKDVVSGDFYWMELKNNLVIFAVADCTGHGVPGAMVSVVCHNALNRAVREFNLIEPAKILDKVRELVIETFSRSDYEVKDGMDIALCTLDVNSRELQYAGANNPLYHIKEIERDLSDDIIQSETRYINEIRADKQPIGVYAKLTPFTNHKINLQKGDSIVLFSDGFADQFGGERGKKFKYKPYKQLLLDIVDRSMEEQKEILNTRFVEWMGNHEQVDDVCVVSVRV